MSDSEFVVYDTVHDNAKFADSKPKAEDMKQTAVEYGDGVTDEDVDIIHRSETDNKGRPYKGVVISDTAESESEDEPAEEPEPVDAHPIPQEQTFDESEEYDLPDKPPVDEDPLVWMPGSFTDEIEGQDVINKQGYEVMAHYYEIGTDSVCEVGPEETDYSYARVTATATTKEGVQYSAQGSAHVDRGDDSYLLLEMADTRARKRALAQATGTGMLAVEELKNEL